MVVGGVVIPPRCAVEVTFRIAHQEFRLRPDDETTKLILGCFGRAFQRYPKLDLYVLNVLSNHGSFMVTPDSAASLSAFMRDFKSTLGKKLNKRDGREGVAWERRYRAIPVLDERAMDKRFDYILTQGTKEDLVWSARDWPGVTSIPTLLGGPPLVGHWHDLTMESERKRQRQRKLDRAAARGETMHVPQVPEIWLPYVIGHTVMPHWRHLSVGKQRARVAQILADDDAETRARHLRDGTSPLGVKGILEVDRFARPAKPKNSPAPRCHASAKRMRRAFKKLYATYVKTVRDATDALRELGLTRVPAGVITPPIFHAPASPFRPPSPAISSTGPPVPA